MLLLNFYFYRLQSIEFGLPVQVDMLRILIASLMVLPRLCVWLYSELHIWKKYFTSMKKVKDKGFLCLKVWQGRKNEIKSYGSWNQLRTSLHEDLCSLKLNFHSDLQLHTWTFDHRLQFEGRSHTCCPIRHHLSV